MISAIFKVIIGVFIATIVATAILTLVPLLLLAHIFGTPFYVTKKDVRIQKYVRFQRVPLDISDEMHNREISEK